MNKLTVSVIGGTTYDHIVLPGGDKTGSFGGISYNLLALSYLMGTGVKIKPLTRLGRKRIAGFKRLLQGRRNVDKSGILLSKAGSDECFLEYSSNGERKQHLIPCSSPFTIEETKSLLSSRLVLFNNILGDEIKLDILKFAHHRSRGLIMMDMHSKMLGTRKNGERYRRALSHPRQWIRQLDILQANEWEFSLLVKRKIRNETGFRQAALEVLALGPRAVVVTRGEQGSLTAFRQEGELKLFRCPAYPVSRVVDTTGCGDVFSAGFIYGYLRHADFKRASVLGNAAAGVCSSSRGLKGLPRLRGLESKLKGELKQIWGVLDSLGKYYSV